MNSLLCSILLSRSAQFRRPQNGEIAVGMTLALTGLSAIAGQACRDAAQDYFARLNREGGINGRRLRLLVLDDGGKSARAEENLRCLIEQHHVQALFATTQAEGLAQRVARAVNLPCLGPIVAGGPAMADGLHYLPQVALA